MSSEASEVIGWEERFAAFVYRRRWWLSCLAVLAVAGVVVSGTARLQAFKQAVAGLGDTSTGSGPPPPVIFDPSLDVWFAGLAESAVQTYYEIENRFIAEDFVIVSFEDDSHPFGVFNRNSLAAISRLTENFLTIPGVRHVRSLTDNPWIRWGRIEDREGSEEGLIISDLVEGDIEALTDDQIIERMVAALGASRVAERVGVGRVRAVLGPDANFEDHAGEPLLLGNIINAEGTTTAIQVQVLRPRLDGEALAAALGDRPGAQAAASAIYGSQLQRAALRGIQHFLRLETGLALPTPAYARLSAWVESIPDPQERDRKRLELADPTRNFMRNGSGELLRKFFEYDAEVGGGYADRSDPSRVLAAPGSFRPQPRVPYTFHLGGEPLFEKNFEDVGMADARFVPLMFGLMIVCLALVFRSLIGVAAPLLVVLAAITATIGFTFARGDLLNNMTVMTPNVLTAVGIADAIHLVAAWLALRGRFQDRETLVVEVIRRNALPVFLTSITTAIGFLSLTLSSIRPVVSFGLMSAFGAITAYLITMAVVPALLSLFPPRPGAAAPGILLQLFRADRAERLSGFILGRRLAIVSTAGALTLVSIIGVAVVGVDNNMREFFPDRNIVMSDYDWIEQRLGGVGDLEIVFKGLIPGESHPALSPGDQSRRELLRLRAEGAAQGVAELEPLQADEDRELADLERRHQAWSASRIGVSARFLETVDAFERRLRREMDDPASPLHVVTDLVSPLDVLRKMHQVQNESRARFYRVPGEGDVAPGTRSALVRYDPVTEQWAYAPAQSAATLVAQYYLQYENGARPGENLGTQLSADRTQFRMQGRVTLSSDKALLAAFQRIETVAAQEFPGLAVNSRFIPVEGDSSREGLSELTLSGRLLLHAMTGDMVASEFIQTMLFALLAITALIGLIFRSLRLALVSMIPNILPILLPLSAFGYLGLPISAPAAFVSAIALGVCVDDTIHFLTHYIRTAGSLSTGERIAETLRQVGTPITVTSIVLVIGFATMLLGEFSPNVLLGGLVTVMIGLAWLADIIVTPAVLSYAYPTTGRAGRRVFQPQGALSPETAVS